MRVLGTFAILLTVSIFRVSDAAAECYGETAHMYGCASTNAPSPKNIGELVYFGGDSAPVLPYRGGAPTSLTDDLFSPEEQRNMLRSIVRGQGSATYSRSSEVQAMNSGARALRRFGNTRVTVYGR